MTDIYQVMPPLTAEEYQALKTSISEIGVQIPIEFDELGNVLDGHHRLRICKELNLKDYPRVIRAGLDNDADKKAYARKINLIRRHLTNKQKQELIKQQLRETPEYSNRILAEMLGCNHKTIGTQRKKLEGIGELPQCPRVTKDKRHYPSQRRPISVFNPSKYESAVLRNNPAVVDKMRDKSISNVAYGARLLNLEDMYMRNNVAVTLTDKNIHLYVADLRDGLPMIQDACIHAIVTDMPYERKYLELYTHLSTVASRVLVEGGSLLCLTGQAILPEVLVSLATSLKYNWTLSYVVSRTPALLPHKSIYSSQKPVAWLTKGEYKGRFVNDLITAPPVEEDEKLYHPHQQSIGGFISLVEAVSEKGDIVADFCMGSGTTGVAAVKSGRSFVGCDIDPKHKETAEARIKRALLDTYTTDHT